MDFRLSLALLLLALGLGACSTTPKPEGDTFITKVKYYHLQDEDFKAGAADPMIPFERKHLLHGALTSDERRARYGNYYTVLWKGKGDGGPVTIQLQYRQGNTGSKILTKNLQVSDPSWRNSTKFEVVGEDYQTNGKVTAWKVTLLRGGQAVSSQQSFLWE